MRRIAMVATGITLAAVAACSGTPPEAMPAPPAASERAPAAAVSASLSDVDGDGFVSKTEAEGYHRRNFGQLDADRDGRLSPEELEPAPTGETAYEDLIGATEQGFVDRNMLQYGQRADPNVGMMSTQDFDEMFGLPDPDFTR